MILGQMFVGLSMAKEFKNLSKTQTFLFGMAIGFMLGGIFMMVVLGWDIY